jgi:tripartite-type tricarboxylate transporter receptor subunit TctC
MMRLEESMRTVTAVLAVLALSWASCALSQDAAVAYPVKPIRLIVPFAAGSATDIAARLVGERLNTAWGQPVVVENRPGAGGTIGIAQVAKGEPDGYSLVVVSTGHVVNDVLYKDLQYDVVNDLSGVAVLVNLPSVLVVSPALGVHTVKELVAAAKAKPGEFNYGTAGIGSAAHINTAKFLTATGVTALHVPLKGTPPILSETMGGRLHFAWVPSLSSMGPLKDGKLLALAVSTPQRIAALPAVPTIAEAGYAGGEFNFWIGLLAPARTPREIVAKLNGEIRRALGSDEMKDRLEKLGGEPMEMTPEQFDRFIRQEHQVLGKVMRDAGARPQ